MTDSVQRSTELGHPGTQALELQGGPPVRLTSPDGGADPAAEPGVSSQLRRAIDDAQPAERHEDDPGCRIEHGLGDLDHRHATGPQLQHAAAGAGGRLVDWLGQLDDVVFSDRRPDGADVDQVFDDLEVLEVVGEQGGAVDVCRRRDREVGQALSRRSASLGDGRFESPPLARDSVLDGKRIGEARLDQAEARSAKRSPLLVGRDQQPEVQLGDRNRADRGCDALRGPSSLISTEVSRTPTGIDLGGPGVLEVFAAEALRSRPSVGSTGSAQRSCSLAESTHCRVRAGPSFATGRPETVIVISSPASARRSTSPTWFRSSFCGTVAMGVMVAVLLPASRRSFISAIRRTQASICPTRVLKFQILLLQLVPSPRALVRRWRAPGQARRGRREAHVAAPSTPGRGREAERPERDLQLSLARGERSRSIHGEGARSPVMRSAPVRERRRCDRPGPTEDKASHRPAAASGVLGRGERAQRRPRGEGAGDGRAPVALGAGALWAAAPAAAQQARFPLSPLGLFAEARASPSNSRGRRLCHRRAQRGPADHGHGDRGKFVLKHGGLEQELPFNAMPNMCATRCARSTAVGKSA